MKINFWLVMMVLVLAPSLAMAEKVKFELVSLASGYVEDVGIITIWPAEDGKLTVLHDGNKCIKTETGLSCTEIAFFPKTVTPKVEYDHRPGDGDLRLALTQTISLEVGSGFNIERRIEYKAIVKTADGQEKRLDLTPSVYLLVK